MSQQLYIWWYGRDLSMDFDLTRLEHGKFNFIMLIARRIGERRNLKGEAKKVVDEARGYFFDFLGQSAIKFGDKDFVWTPDAAFELADEYLSYD